MLSRLIITWCYSSTYRPCISSCPWHTDCIATAKHGDALAESPEPCDIRQTIAPSTSRLANAATASYGVFWSGLGVCAGIYMFFPYMSGRDLAIFLVLFAEYWYWFNGSFVAHVLPKLALVPLWLNPGNFISNTALIEPILSPHSVSYFKPLPANPKYN